MANVQTSTESRALSLLGQGLGPELVASAVGVSVSRISQLLSEPEFAAQVAELRFKNLASHNERDCAYDKMEEMLQQRLANVIPFMMEPALILKAIQVINGAKRRGASAPESITNQQTVVQLVLPTQIYNSFTQNIQVNLNNQVVRAGSQDLVTMPSGGMTKLLETTHGTPKENSTSSSQAR